MIRHELSRAMKRIMGMGAAQSERVFYWPETNEIAKEGQQAMATTINIPGGMELWSSGDLKNDPHARIIHNRGRFTQEYAASKGWPTEFTKLSIDQILEIRDQPEWKHAGLLPYPMPVKPVKMPTFADVIEQHEPPTGDDLTALALTWGVERGEMNDDQVVTALMNARVRSRANVGTRGGLEDVLTSLPGMRLARISEEPGDDGRHLVLYQGHLEPSDVTNALKDVAPATMAFTVERITDELPE